MPKSVARHFEANPTITAKPWGRVEGVVYSGRQARGRGGDPLFRRSARQFRHAHVYDSGKTQGR